MALPPPATLAAIRSEVFLRCTINTGGDRGARALGLVDSMIRRSVRELTVKAPWLRLTSSITIDLVDDVSTYDFPDSMDPGKYAEVLVRNATTEKLLPLSPDPSQRNRNALLESSGQPRYYWFDDQQLNVSPKPDTDYWDQLTIRGYLRAGELVNDTDLVPIDSEAVVQRAEIHLRPRIGLTVTQDMKDTHLAYLRDLRGEQSENSGSMPGGDTSIKCQPQDGEGLPRDAYQYDAGWQPPGSWGP
jgi:hypothetical protein